MKTTKQRLFLDIHAIQTLPPSNVNRDDTGSPKTARYGGVTRARVSSQSWKRAMRLYFNENFDDKLLGVRTKNICALIKEEAIKMNNDIPEEELQSRINAIFWWSFCNKGKKGEALPNKKKSNKKEEDDVDEEDKVLELVSDTLIFLSKTQIKNLANFILSPAKYEEYAGCYEDFKKKQKISKDNKKSFTNIKEEFNKIIGENNSVDIALFGRMVAADPDFNCDASCQVAHAISTHAVETEFDFFTALDDYDKNSDHAGAGHLDTTEFNSSTLYRYANVALHDLADELNSASLMELPIKEFIKAFVLSMPTGKINTFANQTVPEAVIVSLRNDRPLNLITAFEEPVISRKGYTKESIKKLSDEFSKVSKIIGPAEKTFVLSLNDNYEISWIENSKTCSNLDNMIDDITNGIRELSE